MPRGGGTRKSERRVVLTVTEPGLNLAFSPLRAMRPQVQERWKLKIAVGVVAAVLAATASAGCFDQVTDRLNASQSDFSAKSPDEVAFRVLSEWAKEYGPCLPLDVGEFRMLDMIPTPDRAVMYVFEYVGTEELVPDDRTRREIWLSMQRTYCKEKMLSSRGVRLVYSIRDRLGAEVLRVEALPDDCSYKAASA